jgi:PRA1 family protein 1
VPQWGRPPGARLGRGQHKAWAAQQSWPEYDDRFEELETDDDGLRGVELQRGYAPKRFVSDELRFTGIDLGGGRPIRRTRSGDSYDDDYTPSEDDYDTQTGLARRGKHQVMLREKEDLLLERALERIRRARALGKTDAKLSQAEIDVLERSGYLPRPPPHPAPAPKSAPKGKKAAQPKVRAIETKKTSKKDTSSSSSPKRKPLEGRTRGRSTASDRSKSDTKEETMVPYPLLPEERGYPQAYYARPGAPGSQQGSRTNSTQSLRQQPPQQVPPYGHPYYQYRYYSSPDMYDPRPPSSSSRASRPDPSDPDWEPRARSSSSLVSYPLDQLPNQGQGRAPRFDPSDPRFASPPTSRRIVSGLPAAQYRRPQDELFLLEGEQPEVMQYLASSSNDDEEKDEDSDESGQGVSVNVEEKPGGYAIQTRAAASKSNRKVAAKKRR